MFHKTFEAYDKIYNVRKVNSYALIHLRKRSDALADTQAGWMWDCQSPIL